MTLRYAYLLLLLLLAMLPHIKRKRKRRHQCKQPSREYRARRVTTYSASALPSASLSIYSFSRTSKKTSQTSVKTSQRNRSFFSRFLALPSPLSNTILQNRHKNREMEPQPLTLQPITVYITYKSRAASLMSSRLDITLILSTANRIHSIYPCNRPG